MRAPRRVRGFTLIELILVIVLVGAMAVFALPRILDTSAWRLKAFADELQSSSASVQRTALAQRREVRMLLSSGDVQFNYMSGTTVGAAVRPPLICPSSVPACLGGTSGSSVTFNFANSGAAQTSTAAALAVTVTDGGDNQYSFQIENTTGLMRRLP